MKTEQGLDNAIDFTQEINTERIDNLRYIYNKKLEEACPLLKYPLLRITLLKDNSNLPFALEGLSCPLDEEGLLTGIAELELKLRGH